MTRNPTPGGLPAGSDATVRPQGAAAVSFAFEGRTMTAYPGDTVAAALLRNGVHTLSRSVKYRRPRGVSCGRGRCVMCHVEIDGLPGVRACTTEIRDDMHIRRQDFNPPWAPILAGIAARIRFPAGFYFRFFNRPAALRRAFLSSLRRMAGVGRITRPESAGSRPRAGDPLRGCRRADVIVVGAGLSGIAAAVRASEAGATVILLDEQDKPGGSWRGPFAREEVESRRREWLDLLAASDVQFVPRVLVQGIYPGGRLVVGPADSDGTALGEVRVPAVILATGAGDVIPLFENNDRFGVFGVRALRLLLEREGFPAGRRAVVYGRDARIGDACALLADNGIEVVATASPDRGSDHRPHGVHIPASRVVSVSGRTRVESVELALTKGRRRIVCDILCFALSPQPAFELSQQAGFRFHLRQKEAGLPIDDRVMIPGTHTIEAGGVVVRLVGEAAGLGDMDKSIQLAEQSGRSCASVGDGRAGG